MTHLLLISPSLRGKAWILALRLLRKRITQIKEGSPAYGRPETDYRQNADKGQSRLSAASCKVLIGLLGDWDRPKQDS